MSREPEAAESSRLVQLFEQARKKLRGEPGQAKKLAADPIGLEPPGSDASELAAWTVLGNVLLNLDEALMKR